MKTNKVRYFTICRIEWVKEFGSANIAIVAEYIGFLSDKGTRPDGKIWKSDREISEGTGLTQSQVRTARTKLEGWFVNKEVHRAYGAPTNHYKLTEWGESLVASARKQDEELKISNRIERRPQSLTGNNSGNYQETTTERGSKRAARNDGEYIGDIFSRMKHLRPVQPKEA